MQALTGRILVTLASCCYYPLVTIEGQSGVRIFTLILFMLLVAPAYGDDGAEQAQKAPEKTLIWPDGTRYIGGVIDGKRSGKGTIIWKDGTRFVGTFKDDKRNGPGTMILPDGTVYNGYFQNDQLVEAPPSKPDEASGPEVAVVPEEVPPEQQGAQEPPQTEPEAQAPPEPSTTAPAIAEAPASTNPAVSAPAPGAPPAAAPDQSAKQPAAAPPEQSAPKATAEPTPTPPQPLVAQDVTEMTPAVKDELAETITLWAAAWSEQNVVQYLANYSEDFVPAHHQTRAQWEALRKARLGKPGFIKVDVDFKKFEITSKNTARVTFKQTYKSDNYHDVTTKVLTLKKEGHYWRIVKESH